MPVHVKCPGCGSVLAAPDQLAGNVMSCPQCKNQFLVPKAGPATATSPQPPPPPLARTPVGGNGGPPPPPSAGGRISLASLTRQAMPTTEGAPPVATAPVAPAAATTGAAASTSRGNYYPPSQPAPLVAPVPPAAPGPSVARPVAVASPMYPPGFQPVAAPPSVPAPAPKPAAAPQRQVQAAKFISGDASATKIDLGADGKLPELKLEAAEEKDDPDEKAQASNPWILIGLLGFSVVASIVMLFVDPGTSKSEVHTKAEARESIQLYYLPRTPPYERYQMRLKDALLANNRGDRAEEKRLYREVLDILHSENIHLYKGLTGSKNQNDPPPNDHHLESLVSILLGND